MLKLILRADKLVKFRFALLARDGGDWWNNFPEAAKDNPEVAARLSSPSIRTGPERMSNATIDEEIRPAIFREALAAFAQEKGLSHHSIETPDLSADFFNQILFIHLAALTALDGQKIADANDLLSEMIRHERHYWYRALADAGVEVDYHDGFEQVMALLTLIGGTRSARDTRAVINLTPRLRDAPQVAKTRIFDLLREFYEREGGASGLQPDLLGERLIANALAVDDELIDIVLAPDSALGALGDSYAFNFRF